MSESQRAEKIIGQSKRMEAKHDWLKAAELYEKALRLVGRQDFLRKGEIHERTGYCLHRAAFQAESQEEFKERVQLAVEAFERAYGLYEKLTDKQKVGRRFRCDAVVKYLGYWIAADPSEKRQLLDECLESEGKALTAFSRSGNMWEYVRTYNELGSVFSFRYFLEWDRQTCKSVLERGAKWGREAVAALAELGDIYETARAYFALSTCLGFLWKFIADPKELYGKSLEIVIEHLEKAVEFSERAGDAYQIGWSHLWLGLYTGGEESVKHFEKLLECGEQTRDNLLRGVGQNFLAYRIYLKATATEDPDQRRRLAEEAMKFYDKSQHHYSVVSFKGARTVVTAPPWGYAGHYHELAMWETDPRKRLELLEKSEKIGMDELRSAEDSDIPLVVLTVLHVVSKTLQARAYSEPDPTEKRMQLEKALKYREKAIRIHERQAPFLGMWSRGVMQNELAAIKAVLADIDPERDSKRRLLQEAASSMEEGLRLCINIMPYFEKTGDIAYYATLQLYQDRYAELLTHLYDFTSELEHLTKTIEILQKAIESANKLGMVSLVAESHWKIARAQDILEKHLEAAEDFRNASESYMKAAERIPKLAEFYQDYASYMQAWSEIEQAKHHHALKKYGQAKDHYEKAAKIHVSTQRWNYLSLNYSALARLEEAEDLSRKEQTEEAISCFQQAANLFAQAPESIRTRLKKIEASDEKEMASELAKVSDVRGEYCLGRVAIEEAKILDRKGNHAASSEKYGSAFERFEKLADAAEREVNRLELKPIVDLCRAWEMKTRAEAEASPDLYLKASQFFDEAKEHSLDEKSKVLALGHSSFCKALEAGARFEATEETAMYSAAKKHLEVAAKYYLKAGFKNAAEYARATHRLLDAYMYMHNAEAGTAPATKAKYYRMAEKLLEASAGSYMKAKHPEKSEEVQRLLESVREERELAISLVEVLHTPATASTTTSFSAPVATNERAVGLERFEHADIQANVFLRAREVMVGEDLNLEITLVNTGKAPALLIKVEEVIPRDFRIKQIPETYRVEDHYLNMKGKKLDPLKSEELKMVLQPMSKGMFVVKPRILYLDETGKNKSHEPEPVTLTVKELGIRGWIKGER